MSTVPRSTRPDRIHHTMLRRGEDSVRQSGAATCQGSLTVGFEAESDSVNKACRTDHEHLPCNADKTSSKGLLAIVNLQRSIILDLLVYVLIPYTAFGRRFPRDVPTTTLRDPMKDREKLPTSQRDSGASIFQRPAVALLPMPVASLSLLAAPILTDLAPPPGSILLLVLVLDETRIDHSGLLRVISLLILVLDETRVDDSCLFGIISLLILVLDESGIYHGFVCFRRISCLVFVCCETRGG